MNWDKNGIGSLWAADFALGLNPVKLVVTTMKGGAIVAIIPAVLILTLSLSFVGRGRTPQSGLVGALVVDEFPAILDARQSRFHICKLRSRDHVLGASRQDF